MERLLVTIAREYGSGGKKIGQLLAKKLGIPFYGKEELMEIAQGKPDYEEVRTFYEEQPVDSLLYAIAMNQGGVPVGKIPFQRIRELCGAQSCVLIGRCGSYIFKEDPNCVKIFIYTDMESKIKWVQTQEGLSRGKAKKKILQVEEEREGFHKYYTGEGWSLMDRYDLCIDSGKLGTEKTAEVLLEYIKSRGLIENES